jgi:hypothetical protein
VEPTGGSATDPDRIKLADLMAEARAGGKLVGRFTPAAIGYLPVRTYPERTNQVQIPLTCDLDRARIEAIETLRGGGDLTLDLSLQGRFGTDAAFSVGDFLVANQGVWIGVLTQMAYQKTLLIEVPLPDPLQQPEMAAVVGLLAEAQGHMLRGHDRDAVGVLRDVLDRLTMVLGDDDNLNADVTRVLFGNGRSMTKADRLRVLRRALKLVMHPARHQDEVTVNIDWSRIDAAQMITMTRCLHQRDERTRCLAAGPVIATRQ